MILEGGGMQRSERMEKELKRVRELLTDQQDLNSIDEVLASEDVEYIGSRAHTESIIKDLERVTSFYAAKLSNSSRNAVQVTATVHSLMREFVNDWV